jgi:hypothetical protein
MALDSQWVGNLPRQPSPRGQHLSPMTTHTGTRQPRSAQLGFKLQHFAVNSGSVQLAGPRYRRHLEAPAFEAGELVTCPDLLTQNERRK